MPFGIALIGAGNIARVQLEAIKHIENAKVSVVCNRDENRGKKLAESAGAFWTNDLKSAVERDDVDIVSVCTPSGAHLEPALLAARARKHLMVEKPLEISLTKIDQIVSAAKEHKVKLSCFFPSRFMKGVAKTKEAIDQGRLGKLILADAYVKWFRDQTYYDVGWRGTWELDGGGALMNQSIHSIDLLQYLAGPVKSVFAHTATLAHDMETEDTAAAVLRFGSGAIGVIQGSTSCWPGSPARLELCGTKGSVTLEEGRIVRWELKDTTEKEKEAMLSLEQTSGSGSADPMGIDFENHKRQIEDMLSAIENSHEPVIAGEEARKAVEIILAIYQSAKDSRLVEV